MSTIAKMDFSKETHDSGQIVWTVSRNGEYFGQIWTLRAKGENHPFHAKVLNGEYDTFPTLALAKRMMELAAA